MARISDAMPEIVSEAQWREASEASLSLTAKTLTLLAIARAVGRRQPQKVSLFAQDSRQADQGGTKAAPARGPQKTCTQTTPLRITLSSA
jgi:alkylhydroperoxidase/carboxymuconolactone decarboxylase family protein YurZ